VALTGCGGGNNARSQWSIFEAPHALIGSGPGVRERTLGELKQLGADTVRVEVNWSATVPSPDAPARPAGFDPADPGDYPGFEPYDDVVRKATAKGFRVLLGLAPQAPRWVTEDARGTGDQANLRPIPAEFAKFAGAVAKRYSGGFRGLPRVGWFEIWNEPNHVIFLKPLAEAPEIYRRLVEAAVPAVRENGNDAKVLVGETAPSAKAGTSMGPREFIQRWLCLDAAFKPIETGACAGFKEVDADGYAHHPYGAIDQIPPGDVVNMLAIRRLGDYLDLAAEAGRVPKDLPIYNTEFGIQSNPPDPTVHTTLLQQAQFLNEKEEQSYRYPRLKSYAQYLLYDDEARPGPPKVKWSGFQTGLRFADGPKKPSWEAYRLPIVVHGTGGEVQIWGRVRPGSGKRRVELHRAGAPGTAKTVKTDDGGYFEVDGLPAGSYTFNGYDSSGHAIGTSRTASPIP
jgi:hypothetical protein